VLRHELRYQTFHRYCQLNIALEASAELAYRRLVELSNDPVERGTMDRIREDEARHTDAFRLLAAALTDDDRLVNPASVDDLVSRWLPSASGSCRPVFARPWRRQRRSHLRG